MESFENVNAHVLSLLVVIYLVAGIVTVVRRNIYAVGVALRFVVIRSLCFLFRQQASQNCLHLNPNSFRDLGERFA